MPTILIVKDRKAHHQIRGFDELGGTENFSTALLACVLATHGALHITEDERDNSGEILDNLMDD